MRIKVESVAPLPHIKAWFSTSAVPTIFDLKTSLCSDLPLLHFGHIRPGDILLLLDDFELLDSSPIDVVRDGDLVVIKKASAPPSTKRKSPPPDVASPARKRTKTNSSKTVQRTPQPPNAARRAPSQARAQATSHYISSDESSDSSSSDSSSDDTDSSEDSSDSDSDSDSSTDSDDSSSSSSSSASSNAPSIKTSRKPTTNGTKRTNAAASGSQPHKSSAARSSAPPVPPGLGKPATHSRNLRRRRKKMYERLSLTAEPASVNDIPLGTRATTVGPTTSAAAAAAAQRSSHTVTPTSPSQHPPAPGDASSAMVIEQLAAVAPAGPAFMMASLQNKNKRRGFKSALSHGVPPKIVFAGAEQDAAMDVDASADPDGQVVEAAPGAGAEAEAAQPSPPLVRAYGHAKLVPPSRKQARGLVPPNMFVTSVDVEEGLWPVKSKYKNKKREKRAQAQVPPADEEDSFAQGLPYDDVPEGAVATGGQEGGTERAAVAARWDTLRKVTDKAQVQAGTTLAWKALGINFTTLTPEMLLHVGRVLRCDEQLIVEPMAEPGMAEASFGGVPDGLDGGPAEEAFEWTDVLQGDWRLVSAR
ncbi:hypothetical protein BD413DRAFT_722109 [Trametes elegans]|nr:hypothetical protein BD413DRAFT_722109 [Trametes elegans]